MWRVSQSSIVRSEEKGDRDIAAGADQIALHCWQVTSCDIISSSHQYFDKETCCQQAPLRYTKLYFLVMYTMWIMHEAKPYFLVMYTMWIMHEEKQSKPLVLSLEQLQQIVVIFCVKESLLVIYCWKSLIALELVVRVRFGAREVRLRPRYCFA